MMAFEDAHRSARQSPAEPDREHVFETATQESSCNKFPIRKAGTSAATSS